MATYLASWGKYTYGRGSLNEKRPRLVELGQTANIYLNQELEDRGPIKYRPVGGNPLMSTGRSGTAALCWPVGSRLTRPRHGIDV